MIRLWVFDWDGTLIDSSDKIVRCMQTAAREVGLPVPTAEAARDIIGLGLPEAMQRLFPGATDDDAERMRVAYSRAFVAADEQPCRLFPGAASTLQSLRANGHALAVATGKSRRGLNRMLPIYGMEALFTATRCADETASKPDPRMLKELLAELDVAPEEAVMIGDTEYDMAMAAGIGMHRVAVSYGVHAPERLMRYDPVLIIDQLPHLLRWAGSIGRGGS